MMNEHALCAFAEVIGEGDQTALLFDHRGVVRAGMYFDNRGNDVSGEIGAALAGVSVEATRAMRHLSLGEWRAIVCECADANLAMAHSAVTAKAEKYGRTQFMIRSRLYKGLNGQTMKIGPLAEDERLKMVLPQACCYCGSRDHLSADHLIPTKRGGANTGDNLVWACRSCNS